MTAGASKVHGQGVLNLVWEHLLPAMDVQPLPLDEQSYGTLLQTTAALKYPPIDLQAEDTLTDDITGKRYQLDKNQMKLYAVEWQFDGDTCLFKGWNQRGVLQVQVRCGIGHWVEGTIRLGKESARISASGGWQLKDTFMMSWKMIETAYTEVYTCVFNQDSVTINREIKGTKADMMLKGNSGLIKNGVVLE
jgi:hypothetical protein